MNRNLLDQCGISAAHSTGIAVEDALKEDVVGKGGVVANEVEDKADQATRRTTHVHRGASRVGQAVSLSLSLTAIQIQSPNKELQCLSPMCQNTTLPL